MVPLRLRRWRRTRASRRLRLRQAALGLPAAAREALRAGGFLVPLTNRKSSDKCMESLAIPKAVAISASVEVALGAVLRARARRRGRRGAVGSAGPGRRRRGGLSAGRWATERQWKGVLVLERLPGAAEATAVAYVNVYPI